MAKDSYLDTVASLGCIVCRDLGHGPTPAEIHHIRTGMGMRRAGDGLIIPLCPGHHRTGGHGLAFHAGRKAWEAQYGNEMDLLNQTILSANKAAREA